MVEAEFYEIVKDELCTFFYSLGYKRYKIHKGKRRSISFEKETDKYVIPIDIQFLGLLNGTYRFSVHFTTVSIVEDDLNPNMHWVFSSEKDLKMKLEELKEDISKSNFITRVELKAEKYFK